LNVVRLFNIPGKGQPPQLSFECDWTMDVRTYHFCATGSVSFVSSISLGRVSLHNYHSSTIGLWTYGHIILVRQVRYCTVIHYPWEGSASTTIVWMRFGVLAFCVIQWTSITANIFIVFRLCTSEQKLDILKTSWIFGRRKNILWNENTKTDRGRERQSDDRTVE
jgi:hypothetical protein